MNEQLKTEVSRKLDQIAGSLIPFIKSERLNMGLLTGKLGIALFFMYYSRFKKLEGYVDHAYQVLDDISNQVPFHIENYIFSNGFAGLGWLLEHFNTMNVLEAGTDDIFGDYDALMAERMKEKLNQYGYDYIHGGLGVALYMLSKPPSDKRNLWLAEAVDLIESIGVKNGDYISWYDYDLINNQVNKERYNLGLSHGVPSILVMLVKIHQRNIKTEKLMQLVKGAAQYLVSLYREEEVGFSVFPHYDIPGQKATRNSGIAWCYGDLGICVALSHANTLLQDPEIEKLIRKTLVHVAGRRLESGTMMDDSALCHGAAGAAHIFGHFYKKYNDPILAGARDYWLKVSLDLYAFTDGEESFTWDYSRPGTGNSVGLLEGIAGIGLAYISYLDPELSDWDEVLLIS